MREIKIFCDDKLVWQAYISPENTISIYNNMHSIISKLIENPEVKIKIIQTKIKIIQTEIS